MTNPQVINRPRGVTNHRTLSSPRASGAHRLYQRWIGELWSGRRIAEELVSSDFVGHLPNREIRGPAGLQAEVDRTHLTLRELAFVVDIGPIVDGDMVAARWIATGAGRNGPVRYTGNDLLRIANGRVVEYWSGTSRA